MTPVPDNQPKTHQLSSGIHPNNTIRYMFKEKPSKLIVHTPSGDLEFKQLTGNGWYCMKHPFITGFEVKHGHEIEFFAGCIIGGSTIESS